MDNFTPQQFADSVRAAIGTVRHLYGQIDRLNASLKEALKSEPDRFLVLGGLPPQPGKRKEFRVIRYDYGALYCADALDIDEDLDEDESVVDLDSDDELESPRRKQRAIELMPDQPVLVVRTILYDIRQPDDIEPQILYAALDEWRCGAKLTAPKDGEPFRLKHYMANRIIRAITPRNDKQTGDRLATNAIVIGRSRGGPKNPERELSARLAGPIKSVNLYDLDGAGAVEQLAADIKAYWQQHVTTSTTT